MLSGLMKCNYLSVLGRELRFSCGPNQVLGLGSGDSSVVERRTRSKGCRFESARTAGEFFIFFIGGQLSVLTLISVSVPSP